MASLAEIRARLKADTERTQGTGDNGIFPHWNLAEGQTAILRFLPDADQSNTFFWVERAMIKLPFAGIKGDRDSKPIQVQVPCMEMWGETCPILTEVRPWFKDKSLEEMGRKYWKKRSYLFQGFVVESPLKEEKTPENSIRRFIISPTLFNLVKTALMDPEIEELPTDFERGLDFRITKTTKGGYADYSTSSWARRERALNAEERAAIDTHKLFDLKSFLPKKPSADDLVQIKEMFEASVNGEAFDSSRWGQWYRGRASDSVDSDAAEGAAPAPKAKSAEDTPPWEDDGKTATKASSAPPPKAEAAKPAAGGSKADDILRMIRERKAATTK